MNFLSKIASNITLGFLLNLPPEKAHDIALNQLNRLHKLQLLKLVGLDNKFIKPVKCMGIEFPNLLGLAAGLDKNGDYIDALASLGFGYIEIGTVTPKPQDGNPKPRLFRLKKDKALINRMGFNNKGVDYLVDRVKEAKYNGVLGINIGKNATTPIENAVDDYLICLNKVYDFASYITVNISSPNTKNLRDLQADDALDNLLSELLKQRKVLRKKHQKYVPLVVKIAPDLNKTQIKSLAKILTKNNIDGVIATNTSISRPIDLEDYVKAEETGGLSGAPINNISNNVIKLLSLELKGRIPIIGCGGIMNELDARDKISYGAELLQIYTGFIYNGPSIIGDIINNIKI